VSDRQHGLGDDRERMLVQQIVRLGDRARKRALDRQHAVPGVRVCDGVRDRPEAAEGDELGQRVQRGGGGAGVRARRPRIGDGRAHRSLAATRSPQRRQIVSAAPFRSAR